MIKNAAIVNSTAQTDFALICLAGDIVNMAQPFVGFSSIDFYNNYGQIFGILFNKYGF